MLVSGSLIADMCISWPELHNSNFVEVAVVYSVEPENKPAYQRRFPRNNPSTTLAAVPCRFRVEPMLVSVRSVTDSSAGIAQSQGNVHRRDDS